MTKAKTIKGYQELSVSTIAWYFKVSVSKLKRSIYSGKLKAFKKSGKWHIKAFILDKWILENNIKESDRSGTAYVKRELRKLDLLEPEETPEQKTARLVGFPSRRIFKVRTLKGATVKNREREERIDWSVF